MEKRVLITGASRGIGAATAHYLAGQGYGVCLNYRQQRAVAEALAAEIRERYGVACIALQADVSVEAEVVRLFEEMDQQLGSVTHLVNNAGILQPQMKVLEMSAERINKTLTTNVTSYFLCCREAVRRMQKGQTGGAIVNVSSAAARLGSPGEYVDYAASKGAIDVLTKGLSLEVAAQGIRVYGVRPGFIYTDMHADGGEPGRVERIKGNIPLLRGGQPAEVAAAIAWLLSDEASYATGTFIDVAGGR
ncbi:SDR family oxidoreductase [Aeromonas tecta]|uniref:SDR family oxidoreductase n=1 Tax=Aeromonas tecta TaxID=324617 RepID=UPI00068086F0|nr:SDR family oxidoreductase [Aeromonas tecta]